MTPFGWDYCLTTWFKSEASNQTGPQLSIYLKILDYANVLDAYIEYWVLQVGRGQIFLGLEYREVFGIVNNKLLVLPTMLRSNARNMVNPNSL